VAKEEGVIPDTYLENVDLGDSEAVVAVVAEVDELVDASVGVEREGSGRLPALDLA
jgi:hypothetical protein